MSRRAEYRHALRTLQRSAWAPFLTEHSGLPGPRGNLELMEAVADVGDAALFDSLVASDEEYLTACGVIGWGQLMATGAGGDLASRLRLGATEDRWRVREAVAMALQRLGDADPNQCRALADDWAGDPDPLVQRAAVAGICEPRLLRTPEGAAHALALCGAVTASLAARPAQQRRQPDVRTLRQALGYCWSVAVAADPVAGLPVFAALAAQDDVDVQWIVRENRKKSRLTRLLPQEGSKQGGDPTAHASAKAP